MFDDKWYVGSCLQNTTSYWRERAVESGHCCGSRQHHPERCTSATRAWASEAQLCVALLCAAQLHGPTVCSLTVQPYCELSHCVQPDCVVLPSKQEQTHAEQGSGGLALQEVRRPPEQTRGLSEKSLSTAHPASCHRSRDLSGVGLGHHETEIPWLGCCSSRWLPTLSQ